MVLEKGLKALANPTRLRVLELLKNPAAFDGPRGNDGRPLGVTAKALLKHLRCAQPTLNEQMQVLEDIGLVESRKVGRFVVYTRDEERIRQLKQTNHRSAAAGGVDPDRPNPGRAPRPSGRTRSSVHRSVHTRITARLAAQPDRGIAHRMRCAYER